MSCFQEQGSPVFYTYPADLLDDGTACFECNFGHKSKHAIQAFKFEILAEVAIAAIVDGYNREAVTSFTSSLERFYEFYCKLILKSRDFQKNEIDDVWKRVAKHSERQLGAYNIVYMIEEGEPPSVLHEKHTHFRNKVIHEGVIPTREQAIEYGQAVIDVVNNAIDAIHEKHKSLLQDLVVEELIQKNSQESEVVATATLGMATLLSASRNRGETPRTAVNWIEQTKLMKESMQRMSRNS
jgi:glutamyl/glutaminyl-tRNA synthetase